MDRTLLLKYDTLDRKGHRIFWYYFEQTVVNLEKLVVNLEKIMYIMP
jgi:hypothetical protein